MYGVGAEYHHAHKVDREVKGEGAEPQEMPLHKSLLHQTSSVWCRSRISSHAHKADRAVKGEGAEPQEVPLA